MNENCLKFQTEGRSWRGSTLTRGRGVIGRHLDDRVRLGHEPRRRVSRRCDGVMAARMKGINLVALRGVDEEGRVSLVPDRLKWGKFKMAASVFMLFFFTHGSRLARWNARY